MTSSYDKYKNKSLDGCRECPPRKACEGAEISFVGSGCVEGGGDITLRQPHNETIEFHVDCPGNGKLAIKTCESLEGGGDFYANSKCNEDITLCINNEWLHKFVSSRVCDGELTIRTTDDMKGGGTFTANQCNNTNIVLSVNWEHFPACTNGGIHLYNGCWEVNWSEWPACTNGGIHLYDGCWSVNWSEWPVCPGGGLVWEAGCWKIDKDFINDLIEEALPDPDPDPDPDNPCEGVECPEGEICEDGECVPDPDPGPDPGPDSTEQCIGDCCIDGAGTVGSKLTATHKGGGGTTYQWQEREGDKWEDINNEKASTYKPTSEGSYRCKMVSSQARRGDCLDCDDTTTDAIRAEIDKIALRPLGERSSNGGESSSHCTDMDKTGGCTPFRFDCVTDSARICVGSKGKVNLKASTHGCDSDKCPGTQLSYVWYESDRKDGGWKVVNEAAGKELVAKVPGSLKVGDKYYYKCKATCDDFPGGKATIEGGGPNDGKDVMTVEVIECCGGEEVCGKNEECVNDKCKEKDEGPDGDECTTPAVAVSDSRTVKIERLERTVLELQRQVNRLIRRR